MDFFFFFIKKKKAYEMRISGWSSDVCSSDLETGLANNGGLPNAQPDGHTPAWGSPQQRPPSLGDNRGYFAPQRQTAFRLNDPQPGRAGAGQALYRPDRKSVVKGQSVSVRVDLGGGRIVKKKNKTNTTT